MMESVILLLLAAAGELSFTVASEYIGCYKDTAENRDLKLHVEYKLMNNTPAVCIQYCVGQRYDYAAVQNGNECFCGSRYGSHGTSDGCNVRCTGDSSIMCGGNLANSVYKTGYERLLVASKYRGCYQDSHEIREYTVLYNSRLTDNTPAKCIQYCFGQRYEYAAVQYGSECFCGAYYGSYGTTDSCNMPCSGDSSIICGGYFANSVYKTGYELAVGQYLGCFKDIVENRDLKVHAGDNNNNTPNGCIKRCSDEGLPYAGVQFGVQCFCGSRLGRHGLSTGCNMACAGDSTLICGASLANSVYTTGVGKHIGCYKDQQDRDLTDVFPNDLTSNTPSGCVKRCIAKGFAYASVQNGNECHCGTMYGRYGLSTNCNVACSGDLKLMCGGVWANSVYTTGIEPRRR